MRNCNIFMANHTLAQFMYWLVKKVHEEQEGVRFHWHGEVLITIEPTTESYFEDGYRLDLELFDLSKQTIPVDGEKR